MPDRLSAVQSPKNRVGKIFIGYLRKSEGVSTVAAFSTRARRSYRSHPSGRRCTRRGVLTFHVVAHASKALDAVRRQQQKLDYRLSSTRSSFVNAATVLHFKVRADPGC